MASLMRVWWRFIFVLGLMGLEFANFLGLVELANIEWIPIRLRVAYCLLEFFLLHATAIVLTLEFRRRRANRVAELEVAQWIEGRHSAYHPSRFSRRAVRQVLWIPSLLALSVFLFLPEFIGIWSQRNAPRQFSISGHPLNIQRTWIAQWSQQGLKDDYVAAYIIKGAFHEHPIRRGEFDVPFAYVYFNAHGAGGKRVVDQQPRDATRTVMNQGLTITCQEWKPNRYSLRIDCESPFGEFAARFTGRSEAAEWFYAALSTQPTEP
jgi:hypothetical protein